MLRGIDISNYDAGFVIPERVDFCIVKATQGTTFFDKYCEGFISQCKKKGILFGFYHYLDGKEPEQQAAFFAEKTKAWNLQGIPVVDVEYDKIANFGDWTQRFVDKYHAITTVYPVVYCSASRCMDFCGYPLVDDCGLWVAGYPSGREWEFGESPEFPYDVNPWPFCAMWQFTDNGWFDHFDAPIDMDLAYMDAHAWSLYANPRQGVSDETVVMPTPVPSPQPDKDGKKTYSFDNSVVHVDVTIK